MDVYRKNILLVEDEPLLLELEKTFLARPGINVFTAISGNEALDFINSGATPHIIISDLNMPDGNGYYLLKKIKGNNNTKHIPFVILTGETDKKVRDELLEYGCSRVLYKPFDIKVFLGTVAEILGIRLRKTVRYNISLNAKLSLKSKIVDVYVNNISLSGLFFITKARLKMNNIYSITILFPDDFMLEKTNFKIMIVRKAKDKKGRAGYGAEILNLTELKEEIIERYIRKYNKN